MQLLGEHGAQNSGQRDDRADRQVDAARHDHKRHADGDDQQERVIDEQPEQNLKREEAGVHHRTETEQRGEQRDGDDDRQDARVGDAIDQISHLDASASGAFSAGNTRLNCRSSTARAVADWITLTASTTAALTTSVASGGTPMEYVV